MAQSIVDSLFVWAMVYVAANAIYAAPGAARAARHYLRGDRVAKS